MDKKIAPYSKISYYKRQKGMYIGGLNINKKGAHGFLNTFPLVVHVLNSGEHHTHQTPLTIVYTTFRHLVGVKYEN